MTKGSRLSRPIAQQVDKVRASERGEGEGEGEREGEGAKKEGLLGIVAHPRKPKEQFMAERRVGAL